MQIKIQGRSVFLISPTGEKTRVARIEKGLAPAVEVELRARLAQPLSPLLHYVVHGGKNPLTR